jgi:hypothetical protein
MKTKHALIARFAIVKHLGAGAAFFGWIEEELWRTA